MMRKRGSSILPTELSEPATELSEYSILIHGEKKIGKTTLAAMFEDAVFLMTEPGGKALRIYQTPITSWREINEALVDLGRTKRFKTVVLDTADIAYRLCEKHVCKQLGIKHPSDEEWGKGWGIVRTEFQITMAKMQSLGRGAIFISHSHEQEVRRRSGVSSHVTSPTLSGIGKDILESMVDYWVYYGYNDDGERTMYIRSGGDISVGMRSGIEPEDERFLYADGSRIKTIPMGDSPQEAYVNFVAGFKNELKKKGGKVGRKKGKLRIRRAKRT